jgi:exonuclease III
MKKRYLFLWGSKLRKTLLFLFAASILSAEEFCVSTYNAENFFDAKKDGSEYKEFIPSKYGWSAEEAENKFKNILRVVKDLNSSIIALQEVENEALLTRLKNELGFAYHAFSKNKNSATGIGLISKHKISKNESFSLKGYDKFRPILHAKVDIEGKLVSFWINHFPSLKNKESFRAAYSNALKHYVVNNSEKAYILLGDFNAPDYEHSRLGEVFRNEVRNLWLELPKKSRWSHIYKESRDMLDMILPSNKFFENNSVFSYTNGSFEVFKREYLLNSKGKPKGNFMGFSDHLPLKACFTAK